MTFGRGWSKLTVSGHQRVLFSLLQRTRVYSETVVRERLSTLHELFKPSLPEFVQKRRRERRKDILVTYVDGPGKSGASYASLYAEENAVPAEMVVAPESLNEVCETVRAKGQEIAGSFWWMISWRQGGIWKDYCISLSDNTQRC